MMPSNEFRFTGLPRELGYRFPAEWEKHAATWLSYPHSDSYSWPEKQDAIYPSYNRFIKEVSKGEKVCINVRAESEKAGILSILEREGAEMPNIVLHIHPTNDAWCRDYGPAFIVNPSAEFPKAIVSWKYNAWGDKYPHDLDERIPGLIAEVLGIPIIFPGIVMEGGSVEMNGKGTLMTTTSCLLHENRNSSLTQPELEKYLCMYYGVEQILWLGEGINGDDTNGHIDDLTRFFREDGILTMVETNKADTNYKPLADNLKTLKRVRLLNGRQPDLVEIPMPKPVWYDGQRLPASYANFYICNQSLIVPLYRCREDDQAMKILEECFPSKTITGIDSTDIIWGLGSFHCLSQQEPAI
jgi:agmatine deiminase